MRITLWKNIHGRLHPHGEVRISGHCRGHRFLFVHDSLILLIFHHGGYG